MSIFLPLSARGLQFAGLVFAGIDLLHPPPPDNVHSSPYQDLAPYVYRQTQMLKVKAHPLANLDLWTHHIYYSNFKLPLMQMVAMMRVTNFKDFNWNNLTLLDICNLRVW